MKGLLRFAGFFIGLIILVGFACLHAAMLYPNPNSFQPTDPDTIAYLAVVRILVGVAVISIDLAVALSVAFAWHLGIVRPDVSDATRRAVLVFATVFLGVWLLVTYFSLSSILFFLFFR